MIVGGCINEETRDWCTSPHIIRVIKSRGMRWAGHVQRMGKLKVRCICPCA